MNMYILIFDMQFYNFGMMSCLHLCVIDKPMSIKNSNVEDLIYSLNILFHFIITIIDSKMVKILLITFWSLKDKIYCDLFVIFFYILI